MSQAFISAQGLTRRFPEPSGSGELTVFEDLCSMWPKANSLA
jgi:hypothetical protein